MRYDEMFWYEQHAQDEREWVERTWHHVERVH
jgi:hypothetical protein